MTEGASLGGGRVVSGDGTSLGYLTLGSGPTLLCLHGAMVTGLDWLPVARLLADRYHLVLLDRRGHGTSDVGASGHTADLEAQDVGAVIDTIGPVRSILAHSFGAVIALRAMLTPVADMVESLVLYEPPVMLEPRQAHHHYAHIAAHIAAGRWERALTHSLTAIMGTRPEEIAAFQRSRGWATAVSMAPAMAHQTAMIVQLGGQIESYRAIQHPSLLLHGEHSREMLQQSIQALAATLPHATTVQLTGQQHAALSQDPQQLAASIRRGLEDLTLD